MINKKIQAILFCLSFLWLGVNAQSNTVSGKVVDETNLGLPGVNVIIKGTATGTATDLDGNYNLSVPTGQTIIFSFTGYTDQEITISNSGTINIELVPNENILDEIVVTGYGETQNKRLVTTSVQTLDQRVINDRPIARVEQAIQGSAPAVVVIQESGSPGAPQTIRVRGISTAGNAGPLVMVNGVQVPDINFVNSQDIQSINILKDAASSGIYGARGANGVILIETKKGQDGGPQFSLSSYYGTQALATEGEYLNTAEYANYYNESSLYQIRQGESPSGRPIFTEDEIAKLPNTTWIREVSDNASIMDHHLGISGGSDLISYYGSVGYFEQGGIIGNSNFDRKTASLGLNFKPIDKFDLNLFGTYSNTGRKFILENSVNSRVISSVAALPPLFPARDSLGFPFNNGDQTGVSVNGVRLNPQPEFGNPLFTLDYNENKATSDAIYFNAAANYRLTDRIQLSTTAGYMDQSTDSRLFFPRFEIPSANILNLNNTLILNTQDTKFLQWEAFINYNLLKNESQDLGLILGTSLLQNELSSFGFRRENLVENALGDLPSEVDSLEQQSFSAQKNTTQSFFAKANYNLSDKYLFSATVRADGSSKFGPNSKWGIFPSVSAGWLISSEDFLKENNTFNLLKLRASWGVNGNDQIAPYQYISRFLDETTGPQRLDFNEDVKWEEVTQLNFGIDANMLENKIGITLDYYIKDTKDMLLAFPVPGFLGLPAPIRNAASISNKGIEAILLYRDKVGSDFKYEIGLNFGSSTNKVTDLNGGAPIASANLRSFANSPDVSLTDLGHPIASFYGYEFDGVDEIGNSKYVDQNNDGIIDPQNDRTFIGNPFPDFIYGINLRIGYKNFDLSTFASGTQGNDVVNSAVLYSVVYGNRTQAQIEDMWTHENTSGTQPRPSATQVVNNEFSDYFIEDGSYLRLKNITLGYTVSESLRDSWGLSNFRVFLSANNLFTFTNYSGLDPEIGANNDPLNIGVDQGFYPQAKSIIGGININF